MKKFLKEYWPFVPLILIVTTAILLIAFAVIGDIYSYFTVKQHNVNYRSDGLYDTYWNSLKY